MNGMANSITRVSLRNRTGLPPFSRPQGRAPAGKVWESSRGVWVDAKPGNIKITHRARRNHSKLKAIRVEAKVSIRWDQDGTLYSGIIKQLRRERGSIFVTVRYNDGTEEANLDLSTVDFKVHTLE